jgi:hypothetical protein
MPEKQLWKMTVYGSDPGCRIFFRRKSFRVYVRYWPIVACRDRLKPPEAAAGA